MDREIRLQIILPYYRAMDLSRALEENMIAIMTTTVPTTAI